MKIIRKLAILLLALLSVMICVCAVYYQIVTSGTRLQPELLQTPTETAAVLDRNGDEIADISLKNANRNARLEELPAHVRQAFIASEDKNFYRHHGLDYGGMARALLKNLRARSFRQGASTISQQLVKNTHLSGEKTIRRKLQEIKLAKQLERNYTKDEILSMYLNTIYFGHACYGIASAADFYFGKDASQLDPAESATLAAVIRSPNRYSPFIDREKCHSVRDNVLQRMRKLDFLTEEEYETALKQPLPQERPAGRKTESYLDAVFDELEQLPIFSPYSVRGGYTIYTYMDPDLQKYTEQLQTDVDRSGKSLLVADTQSRGIIAWYATEGNICRQPGSLFKPLAVYAPAIEENLLSPCTPILDQKTNFGGYAPSNYRDLYAGYISARQALSESRNIPAVRILYELGIDRGEKYLDHLGLPLQESDRNLSLALGGITKGYTLPELGGAYATFADGGKYAPLAFIRKIEDPNGHLLYERTFTVQPVFSEDTAALINDMLQTAAHDGTAKKLSVLPFEICGKTGTCGTETGNTDAWTIAYTSEHLMGVWMGNADNSRTDISGGGLPCHYAALLAKHLYAIRKPTPFPHCDSVIRCKLDRASYECDHIVRAAAPKQPSRYTFTELFRKSNLPTIESPIFAHPNSRAQIHVRDNNVLIDLCQTQYYEYRIKKEVDGKEKTILDGPCSGQWMDSDIVAGKRYTYTVTPYYRSDDGDCIFGEETKLPAVYIRKTTEPPKNWWQQP